MNRMIFTKKTLIYMVVTCFWIVIIFSFSLQPADTSSKVSSGLGKELAEVFVPDLVEKSEAMSEELLEYLHFLLRKLAHFSEYFILGMLVMLTLQSTKLGHKVKLGLFAGVLVAATDETIQRFVSGRSGQLSDVVLDSVGVVCGIGSVILAIKVFGWMKRHLNKRQK